jgi:acyl-coenzyme A synthetase/AMP-(fatty) acid ligase
MEYFDWLSERFGAGADLPALVWDDRVVTYRELSGRRDRWVDGLANAHVREGDCVAVVADYSPASISCLLALMRMKCIMVPLSRESGDQHSEFQNIAEVDHSIEIDERDQVKVRAAEARSKHPLLEQIRISGEPGLVVFSSGSTGTPKGILHSVPRLLEKFRLRRRSYRTIGFLLFDHLGGFNTLFYTLANLGCLVMPQDRSVAKICEAIEKYQVELLPTSPSFLNLMLAFGAHKTYNLSCLKRITYGTEVMPERTLKMAHQAFSQAEFQQTYGLSELGILRSKSVSSSSVYVKLGGEDYETKVVDGRLWIRTKCSMLGYLNALSPFDGEGWFDTEDEVVQHGEYYRILGRTSDIVNVGGQKVYPVEVEKVVAELPWVIDVSVSGEQHLLLGQIVTATVQTANPIPAVEVRKRIGDHCRGRLQPYMIPRKVRVVTDSPVNYRFKKLRR